MMHNAMFLPFILYFQVEDLCNNSEVVYFKTVIYYFWIYFSTYITFISCHKRLTVFIKPYLVASQYLLLFADHLLGLHLQNHHHYCLPYLHHLFSYQSLLAAIRHAYHSTNGSLFYWYSSPTRDILT